MMNCEQEFLMQTNNIEQKIMNLLSMAQRANKLVSGEFAVEKAVPTGKIKLLLVASDTSEAGKKQYNDMALSYNVPLYFVLTKDELGQCIGKAHRAVAGVLDNGFSKALKELLNTMDKN